MSAIFPIKAGDAFVRAMRWRLNGVGVDLTGYTFVSKVRRKTDSSDGPAVATLTITPDADQGANPGVFEFDAGDTSAWPIGSHECDITFIPPNGRQITTKTFAIEVARRVSR